MITSKTFIYHLSTSWTLLSKGQHPVFGSRLICLLLKPIFHNFTTSWIMIFVMATFKTKFLTAFTLDVLVRNELTFSTHILAIDLRTPSCVFVIISIISVVPEHVLVVIIILALFVLLVSREELHKHRKWDDYVAVFLLASCVDTGGTSFYLFF